MSEKFHPYLSHDLLALDALSSKLAPRALSDVASRLTSRTVGPKGRKWSFAAVSQGFPSRAITES